MTSVLVLGANGMLGSMVVKVLTSNGQLRVVPSTRQGANGTLAFDASSDSVREVLDATCCDWIVNAIGILDRQIDESDHQSIVSAIDINAAFPHRLAAAVAPTQSLIHFSTDGVFAGQHAPYDENASPDAESVYGRSKILGELSDVNAVTLRCSIVGTEAPPASSLLGWALSTPSGGTISGYTNHRWNGLTTLHLAKLCAGIILANRHDLPSALHVVPADSVSKAELLSLLLSAFDRTDVTLRQEAAPTAMDRTLRTIHPDVNRQLWSAAGYPTPPTIAEMVRELAGRPR